MVNLGFICLEIRRFQVIIVTISTSFVVLIFHDYFIGIFHV